jgi:xylulokinase
VYGRTRWLLTPGDYLVFRLTDEVVTDPLNAEKFFFDVDRWSYPAEFFREAGLEISHLPPVRPMGTEVGQVTSSSAAALGLVPGVPVVLSTYDAICAFWGSGVREHGDVADVSGTVTSVRVLSEHSATGHAMAIFSQAVPGLGHHVVGGSNNLGGGLVEWLKQSFYATESLAYATMEHEAAASGPGARGILFLPYLLGERCPIWDPHARGVFFGLERQHQRGDFARAVFESAAFGLEHVLRTVREHSIQPAKLRISGGLARIGLVSLIKCDVTGLVTEVVDEFETAALGAYMVAATGCGVFSTLSDAANVARVREVILPNAAREARYREWMDVYLELYARLRPLFAARHELLIRHGISGTERLENL